VATSPTSLLSARLVRRYDIVLVVWIVFWVVLAVVAAAQISSLTGLTDPIVRTADGLQKVTGALSGLGNIPLIGGSIGNVVKQVDDAVSSARTGAADAKSTIHTMSWLVGIALGVGMVGLGLLLYLPVRLAWRREVADVRRALAAGPDDPVLGRFLAYRALRGMDYSRFRAWDRDPFRPLDDVDVWPLADLELDRLGLSRR